MMEISRVILYVAEFVYISFFLLNLWLLKCLLAFQTFSMEKWMMRKLTGMMSLN